MPKKARSTVETYTRSYLFKVDPQCNVGKLEKLHAMQAEWQRMLPVVGQHVWAQFLHGVHGDVSLSSTVGADSVFGDTLLVCSMKQCMAVAVEGQLKAWKSNLQKRITRLIMRSDKYARAITLRHQLLWLNSMQLWMVPLTKQQAILTTSKSKTKVSCIDERCSRLLQRYLRMYLRKFKGPSFENLPMQVNQLSSTWSAAQQSSKEGVGYWLRVSTLERRRCIELPILANSYAERFHGTQALTFSLVHFNEQWYVKVCKKFPKPTQRSDDGSILGLDTGMVNLVATSQGAIFGQGFNTKLRRWDDRLQQLTKGLQGAGVIRLSQAKRYRDFVQQMRAWVTSEVKGAVNRALALGQPSTVVIEALNFSAKEGTLSKKMNRLIRRMGTGIFQQTLTMKSEEQGFRLVQVNPAYTSQECTSCGFIARKNRKGNDFRCVCCGKQAHADAQAARTLVKRFHTGRVCEYVKHTTLGLQGLDIWAGNMLARVKKAPPGSLRFWGVVGHVRAGMKHLDGKAMNLPSVQALQRLLSGVSSGSISTR